MQPLLPEAGEQSCSRSRAGLNQAQQNATPASEAILRSLVYVISGCFWMGAGGGRDFWQKDKDMSAVLWFGGGVRVSACMQRKDRRVLQVRGCGSGVQRRQGDLAKWGLPGERRGCICLFGLWAIGLHRRARTRTARGTRFAYSSGACMGQGALAPGWGVGWVGGGGQTTCVWVCERRGEAASRRGEERRVCMAMSVSAWEVRELQAARGGSVRAWQA